LLAAAASGRSKAPQQRVTIFSDSVGAALNWDSTAKRIVEHGDHVRFELHPCGRLTQPGCLQNPPPSVLATVRALGRRIGPTVVVFIGYNDSPAIYRSGMPVVLKAMWRRGVQHVLWLTLRAVNKQYVDINHAIYAAEPKWRPAMTVLDWNHYSAPHRSWYAEDGIHLSGTGAVGFATYVQRWQKKLGLTGPLPTG
jgi:lysophospholipase L1-like esterase